MIRISTSLCSLIFLFTIFSQTLCAENTVQQPILVGGEIIVYVDATKNSGTAEFSLFNDSNLKMPVILRVDEFLLTNQTEDNESNAEAVFKQEDGSKNVPIFKILSQVILFL